VQALGPVDEPHPGLRRLEVASAYVWKTGLFGKRLRPLRLLTIIFDLRHTHLRKTPELKLIG
jgi:hypothetical protein